MASYCEVCRGSFFTPHPHTSAPRRASSCPYWLLPSRHPSRSVASPSQRPAMIFRTPNDAPARGLASSPAVRSGSAPCGPAPFWQSRDFSEPLGGRQDLYDSQEALEKRFDTSTNALPRSSSMRHRRHAATPPPLPPPTSGYVVNGTTCDGGRRYTADTFSSWQHAEGCSPPFDYLRRGEGVAGQRHPSRPPSRESSGRSQPNPSSSAFFLDHFFPQRALEEECCYSAPRRALRDGGGAQGRPPHAAPTASTHDNAFPSLQQEASPRSHDDGHPHGHHDGRRRGGGENKIDEAQAFSQGPSPGHRHRSRSHSREHRHRHLSHLHSSSASHGGHRQPPLPNPEAQPHSLLSPSSGAYTGVSPRHDRSHREPAQHASHRTISPPALHSEAGKTAMLPLSGARSAQQCTRPAAFTAAARPSSPEHATHSLGDLIAKIRAEVSKGAAASRELPDAATSKPAKKKSSGRTNSADAAEGAGEVPATEAEEAAVASYPSLTTSTPVSTAEEEPSSIDRTVAQRPPGQPIRHERQRVRHTFSPPPSSSSSSSNRENERATIRNSRERASGTSAPKSSRKGTKSRDLRTSSPAQRASSPRQHRRTCSLSSSSSSAPMRRAVQEAEAVLQQMRRRARGRSKDKAAPRSNEFSDEDDLSRKTRVPPRTSASDTSADRSRDVNDRRWHDNQRHQPPQQHRTGEDEKYSEDAPPGKRRKSSRGSHSRSQPPTASPAARSSPLRSTDNRNEGACLRRQTPPTAATETTAAPTAFTEDTLRTLSSELRRTLERRQEDWCAEQGHRIERLREGLSSLCVAVRKDLRTMREEVADVRGQSNDVAARVATAEAAQRRPAAPPSAPRTEKGPEASLQPECVVAWVAQCSPADQRRLAQLLLPHLRPALSDAIRDEVQHQLRAVRTEHREELREIEGRLRAYVEAEEAVVDAQQNAASQRRSGGAGSPAQPAESSAPLWAGFSSGDAFNAHLRATARAVLVEEDDRRYSLANDNERRHEMRVRELQRHWQATLVEAQHTWKAEWRSMLHAAEEAWTRQAQAPLQQHADLLQKIVTTLTRDVTHLHERQDAQAASVQESLHKEREMRQREQAKFAERVEQSVRQLLPREVESACARYHVQRERTAATELCGTRATHGSSGSGASPLLPPTASAQLTAEELRLSVVQPALEHMRRLLASHQEMMDAVVEGRCRRAEGVMEGSRHVWLQNVTELRGKVSSLRSDVRGAFNELCSNLNVASPAL